MHYRKHPKFHVAMGKTDTLATLEAIELKFARGELNCIAVRAYNADGTWDDLVIGGDTEEERAQALADLQACKTLGN